MLSRALVGLGWLATATQGDPCLQAIQSGCLGVLRKRCARIRSESRVRCIPCSVPFAEDFGLVFARGFNWRVVCPR